MKLNFDKKLYFGCTILGLCFTVGAPTIGMAAIVPFNHTDTMSTNILGIPFGSVTWKTQVELIVPKTVLQVGEVANFTILGNITNTTSGIGTLQLNPATVFGSFSDELERNVEKVQPFRSTIQITNPKIFVGPSNDWKIRASDQVSSGTASFSGTIAGVGAAYQSTVDGPSVSDWFELIGESNQKVRIENRVLSASDHGKFTGSGASFKIDGFFKDLEPGKSTLSFLSEANYFVYGLLAAPALNNRIVVITPINLSIEVESVPEPSDFYGPTIFGLLMGCGYLLKRKRKLKKIEIGKLQ